MSSAAEPSAATPSRLVPRVLSIAGTDPTGGAGIHADLKSIAANGGYGMAVVTALVAQNTHGVRSIHVPPASFLEEQLRAVSDDVEVDAVKIGMLFDEEIIAIVGEWLTETRPPLVVIDPVMVATSGDRLLAPRAESALRELLALADLVTPNRAELAALLDEQEAQSWGDSLEQARRLSERSRVAVLAKGGHFEGDRAPDAFVDAASGRTVAFSSERVRTRNTHGTGCSLSAAVATLRARRGAWEPAIEQAKAWLTESLQAADDLAIGTGNGPISHFAGLWERGGSTTSPALVRVEWWESIGDIREATDALPFVRGLGDGTLPREQFVWYLAQDALYLRDYARVLAHASALAPEPDEQAFWAQASHGALAAEVELHARWLSAERLFDADPAPATTAYLDHLLALAARGDYGALVAGVLPCFWMYVDIGERLRRDAREGNPYAPWLETYGDPVFRESANRAIEIVAAAAMRAADADRARMCTAFRASARHEHDFFAAPSTVAQMSRERIPRRARTSTRLER